MLAANGDQRRQTRLGAGCRQECAVSFRRFANAARAPTTEPSVVTDTAARLFGLELGPRRDVIDEPDSSRRL